MNGFLMGAVSVVLWLMVGDLICEWGTGDRCTFGVPNPLITEADDDR